MFFIVDGQAEDHDMLEDTAAGALEHIKDKKHSLQPVCPQVMAEWGYLGRRQSIESRDKATIFNVGFVINYDVQVDVQSTCSLCLFHELNCHTAKLS